MSLAIAAIDNSSPALMAGIPEARFRNARLKREAGEKS
jgi:hypothetical protein